MTEKEEGIPISILSEINILEELKGQPNIIKLKDVFVNKKRKNIYIVYDYNEFDVHTLIYQKQTLTIEQIGTYIKQMIEGLQKVHKQGYIHGDIKPKNFLITSNNEIKIIDFGVSELIEEKNKHEKIGTLNYNAPEIIAGTNNYDETIDIWSLGCTIYEMITQEKFIRSCRFDYEVANQMIQIYGIPNKNDYPQFFDFPNKDLFLNYVRNSKSTLNDFLTNKLKDEFKAFKNLLLGMLQFNPLDRKSLEDALNDPVLYNCESPKNLPLINMKEINIFNKSSLKKKKKNIKIDENLRPSKIIPPNFV